MTQKILLLPGDGIGQEVMEQAERVLRHLMAKGLKVEIEHDVIGGTAIDKFGKPLDDSTLAKARACGTVLLGAVGGPKWDKVDYNIRPEAGLLRIRKELDLFANLRPAIVFPALAQASSLKTEIVSGLDILIVRELTGGVYFGNPRGIEDLGNGERRGINTQVYTTSEIKRVARVAFELARTRKKQVTSCEKANVMESGKLWREEVTALHAAEYSDVQLSHMYADNAAMQLVRNPKQFDVIVTDNLFGDILSDEAAMLTGSLGMLPSASLNGKKYGLYEPVHGSAPDIAGKGVANPLAMILSLAMALRYSLDQGALATQLESAVAKVLDNGIRTADIMQDGMTKVGTAQMGSHILNVLG
ncbi:MAG: 3-isopropylmalate dehydrogenase [Alphaproteobacteria bacterium]|nr:MAG: 3-isopropylmalate dehydrogenase [Alphaproteobacteria bacterium]